MIHRRPYSVPGPNSLWHIDSHHKLIRWRIITHGGIDGFSRFIVYLDCSTNNSAERVYEHFINAINKYNLPSRVRSDYGLENVLVARHMIDNRGTNRRSMITGSSTHNQRIERLWRDMHQSTTILYYKLFYFMEHHGLLDPLSEHHLWALHYVFIPRISRSLREFTNSWNHHPLRTANHKSPFQLFTSGILMQSNFQVEAFDFDENVNDLYGIDHDGPLVSDVDNEVHIPQSSLRFFTRDIATLRGVVNPLSPSDNYGIDLYEQTVQYITTLA
jgi:hypothetical protein